MHFGKFPDFMFSRKLLHVFTVSTKLDEDMGRHGGIWIYHIHTGLRKFTGATMELYMSTMLGQIKENIIG